MALIKNLEPSPHTGRNRAHSEVRATYEAFSDGGHRYVQIASFGSTTRMQTDMPSQILQINEESARILFEILKREFDLA